MNEPTGRFITARTINRGFNVAPALAKGIGLTFVFALVGSLARVAVPILMQQTIDKGLQPGNIRLGFIMQICAVAAVSVAVAAFSLRQAVLRLGIGTEEGLYTIRVKLFDHIHRLSLADHNEERRGALVSRVTSDIETLTMFFSWGALVWLLDGSLMFVVACVMLAYDWILALVAFAVSAPLFIVLRNLQKRLVAAYDLAREHNAELLGSISELISGTETLRAYQAHQPMVTRSKKAVRKRANSQIRAGVIGAFLFPSGEVFAVFTIVAIITVGVFRGIDSGLTAGSMVGFVFLTYRFLEPIAEFTEVVDQTQTAVAGLRRVLGVLDTPTGPQAPSNAIALPNSPLSIELNEIGFSYSSRLDSQDDDLPVLRNISLKIPAQQHIALVGASGSGKTTLARLIARFADPNLGSICLGGVNLKRIANDELRRRLVVVPQEPFLFAASIADNLFFASPSSSRADLIRVIQQLELTDWIESMPSGLDTLVGQRGSAISAGERQLVALARAALTNPDVLILDEATSAVDAIAEVRLAKALQALSHGRTTISIAHRLSTAARADRVIVLEHGVVTEDGSHEQLLRDDREYAKIYAQWLSATSVDE
ncbi:MAG: ABC transporter ATP-binding protein [Actinomycetota bacterium]|nr:ABC transporter ATP-binding protein [Actinomycetota bacterium]MDA3003760.1 ABC transporter ATP-binding protein [Actinomycetota bacterium]